MRTIVVSSAIANKYRNGGNAWAVLNWILGFQRLGFTVYFLEQIGRRACVDEAGTPTAFERSVNLAYFKSIAAQFGLCGMAALIYEDGEQVHGMDYPALLDLMAEADLLVNITGHLTLQSLKSRARHRAYVDLDPGFTQFWHAAGNAGARLEGHDAYVTIGANIATPHSSVPTGGLAWRHTRPPVVLEHCPPAGTGERNRFTTVATWRGPYGPIQFGGRTFGLKVHEFRKVVELPERAQQRFEVALDIHPADNKDLHLLRRHHWHIVDPRAVAPDPASFDQYVRGSSAEFSVAQGIYVETNSGWFSDRSARYLAAGRPVLVQDTGFSRSYPVGEGLLAFHMLDQAANGASQISRDYEAHCRAARALAEEYFDSDTVLSQFIADVGA
jgi:hypothetical protein